MSYRRFRRIAVVAFAAVYATVAQQPVTAQHSIAAIEKDRFHGWPANNGAWQWGDELLVGFTQGDFAPQDGHNIAGIQQSKFARSLDGGVTWQVFDPENFLDGEDIKWLPKGKTMLDTPMDFANPGFAMRVFASGYHGNDDPEGGFYFSYDRGATWKGPHFFATRGNSPEDARRGDRALLNQHEAFKGKMLTPRTDYIVTGPKACFVFISTRQDTMGRIACIQTTDGGLTFDFVSWVTPDTTEYRAIMPQTVRLSNGAYVMAFRKIFADQTQLESTIEAYGSEDQCKSWRALSTVKEIKNNSNPPAMVELDDGRLCCVYGDRDARVLAGRYSSDRGATWGPEFTIRDGYLTKDDWADMGYPRLLKRSDGKLAVLYYWATDEQPQHFIACSIWDPASADAPQQQDLFYQGMNGVPVYRIPALAVTASGAVIAVCDARADTGEDLPNDIDLVMRRSVDNGATWSDAKVIADFGKQGCGDSALLVDRSNGRVWCFFTYAPDGVGVATSKPGVTGNTLQLYLMHSDDEGVSWSKPRNITADVKDPAWEAVWSSPGRGYQDSKGRLYFPHSRKSGDTLYSHLIYSDDHGETWHAGGTAGEKSDEWMLVERGDGTLLGNFRSNAGQNRRATATSSDRGATWRDFSHVADLVDPVCQACLIRYDYESHQYLLFSNPADTERRRLTIRASKDEGKSWPIAKVLHEGPAAYSCMAVLADGQIGILYERGDDTPYRKVTFAKFTLDWLVR